MDEVVDRVLEQMQLATKMRSVKGEWTDRFDALRHNYRVYSDAVARGIVTWGWPCDHYVVADWLALMTPIEKSVWDELRSEGLSFWPQFPVGRYMVDFADPVRRIALECDGAAFHDAAKDRRRDEALAEMGWVTYRIPGRECFADEIVFQDRFGTPIGLGELRGQS